MRDDPIRARTAGPAPTVLGAPVDGPPPARRRVRRWAWAAGIGALVLAAAIAGVDVRGTYDPDQVFAARSADLCDLVDTAPLRAANPLADRTDGRPKPSRDSGGDGRAVGLDVRHCRAAYRGDDDPPVTAATVQAAAGFYPSRRTAGLAYNELKRDGVTLGSRIPPYSGPALPDPLTSVFARPASDAAGLGVPEAFCAELGEVTAYWQIDNGGYLLVARDSNLVVQVAVVLVGERMSLGRARYAAAVIARNLLTSLRVRSR